MSNDGINRRKFLGLAATGAAATFMPESAWADESKPSKRAPFAPASPRIYSSDRHTDARMHLGGIGTGNFEVGADGRLTTWQLFNTLRDGQVPFYFAVKVGDSAKLLQTAGGPDWPRIKRIEMTGEYPIATLRFKDDDLPIQLELSAFTPFAPLDVKMSSMPLAIFRFRIHNPTARSQVVSLAALLTNPVGYAAMGEIEGCSHPSLGANVTESFREGPGAGLFLRAQSGQEPTLDRPVSIYLLNDLFIIPPDHADAIKNYASRNPKDFELPPLDRPESLKVEVIDSRQFSAGKVTKPADTVIWLEDAPVSLSASLLLAMTEVVKAGATLVFSGGTMPLLSAYAAATEGKPLPEATARPDILFEDFEQGYGKWTVSGDAFGTEPAHGTFPNQQPVSGFAGKGLVNSYVNGDDATGKLTSQTFTIERGFIHFLVGGGHFTTTQVRLIIKGKTVRATSGKDNEQLIQAVWDVKEWLGHTAHIEIVDDQKGGWGHINVDQIVFTDLPANWAVSQMLEELLPIRFETVQKLAGGQFSRALGAGKVVLLGKQLLNPAYTDSARVRQTAYAALCSLVGATYTLTHGQSAKEPGFGTLALAALSDDTTGQAGFRNWEEPWKQFRENGRFNPIDSLAPSPASPPGETTNAALAVTLSVAPGAVSYTHLR